MLNAITLDLITIEIYMHEPVRDSAAARPARALAPPMASREL